MDLSSHFTGLSVARRFQLVGAAILVVGSGWAARVRATAAEVIATEIPLARTRVEERQLEIIGGRFAVEAARLDRWFDSLWVGRQFAVTLFVLSLAAALLCFWIGHLAARPPVEDEGGLTPPAPGSDALPEARRPADPREIPQGR